MLLWSYFNDLSADAGMHRRGNRGFGCLPYFLPFLYFVALLDQRLAGKPGVLGERDYNYILFRENFYGNVKSEFLEFYGIKPSIETFQTFLCPMSF